jgi:hypothetical protein
MDQLYEYRGHLLDRYNGAAREFRQAALSHASHPRGEGEWSVHQLAAHTRDVQELVYGARIRRTLEEENPLFENFDGDVWMANHYKPDEPLETILDSLVKAVDGMVTQLRGIASAAWTRPSRHATYGADFTLQTWVERGLAHIEEHLNTVKG